MPALGRGGSSVAVHGPPKVQGVQGGCAHDDSERHDHVSYPHGRHRGGDAGRVVTAGEYVTAGNEEGHEVVLGLQCAEEGPEEGDGTAAWVARACEK